ncbi:CDF-like metal transporter, partial [Auricularia subglabra TFB-10046 SS5]
IDQLLRPLDEQAVEAQERENASRLSVRIAVHASLVANLALCILQLYAALTSRSLSLIATAVDSVFDIASNLVLYWVHRRAAQLDKHKWPLGPGRVETVGNIVFGTCVMSAVNLVVVVESIHLLFERYDEGKLMPLHVPSLVGVAAALGAKLLLFLYCFPLRRQSSQVQMLWEDHRNDIFINGFGLLMSAGGSKLIWFLDPMGGVIIGCGVIAMWTWTLYGLFRTIAGVSAPDAEVRVVLYQALTSAGNILRFRDLKVYYVLACQKLAVEITAVFSPDVRIFDAHLAGVQLRDRLQTLPQIVTAVVLLEPEFSDEGKAIRGAPGTCISLTIMQSND